MKKILLLPAIILPMLLCAQVNLKNLRQKSFQAFAYRITAAAAEKYNKLDSIDIDAYLPQTPAFVFNADSVDETKLPTGLYVIIKVNDNNVNAYVTSVTSLVVYTINNLHRVQLLVRSKAGDFINNAHVWVNNKEAVYDTAARSYRVKQRYPDGAVIKVYAPGDTAYITLQAKQDRHNSLALQRWRNFKLTRFARTVGWLPNKMAAIFKKSYYAKPYGIKGPGTIVLNQPKYKKTDTVKLKAYLFDKKWRRYNKSVYLYLEHFERNKETSQFIKVLNPVSPGSFIGEIPLSDTLEGDNYYYVRLKTKQGLEIRYEMFRIEDYVLDEVASYKIRSSKENYYPADTMHFYTSAADANGLPLLDATAQLVLTTAEINSFNKDSIYIPDTLYVQKKTLLSQGETVFDVPANILPPADLAIKASLSFSNSNNEIQNRYANVNYSVARRQLMANIQGDSVKAEYRLNGNSIAAEGLMKMEGGFDEGKKVHFPFSAKIDPLAGRYIFYAAYNGVTDSALADIFYSGSAVHLTRISSGDTLGFVLNNRLKIPVSFTVFDGNNIIGQGAGTDAAIQWKQVVNNTGRLYTVKWQYWWNNMEEHGSQNIAVLYKLLNIHIAGAANVFPGQRDTIRIDVNDYKNRPVKNADLTAVSYNSQFANSIHVDDPPYLVKYKKRPILLRQEFNAGSDMFNAHTYPLGSHRGWIKNFGLDTLLYYQMLLPATGYFDAFSHISRLFSTQLGVHAVKQGQKQQIYMLYINRQLVYYSGVTDKMPYAFEVFGGYNQVGMRLYDKYIEIDSIYIQRFYKHDLVFDIDNLPPNTKVYPVKNYYSGAETNLLEQRIWQLDNNYYTNGGYVWQGNNVVHLNDNVNHLAGPFNRGDSMHFFVPGSFDIHYRFESGYEYDISRKVLRLEKKKIFPLANQKYFLPKVAEPGWSLGDTLAAPPAISYPQPRLNLNAVLMLAGQYDVYDNKPGKGNLCLTVTKDTILQYIILYRKDFSIGNKIMGGEIRTVKNITPGVYTLLLVDFNNNTAQIDSLRIKADTTLCINTGGCVYADTNAILTGLLNEAVNRGGNRVQKMIQDAMSSQNRWFENRPVYETGKGVVTGNVISKKTRLPVSFASVTLKGTSIATATDAAGIFILRKIKPGVCKLVVTSVGYSDTEISVNVTDDNHTPVTIVLRDKVSTLDEIVVTGYSAVKRKDLTGAVSVIREQELSSVANGLTGKVSGLQISGQPGAASEIRLRGITAYNNHNPLIIIDGIVYHEIPANITPDMISDVTTMKADEATAVYGSDGANGVIIITTKTKALRTQFRDYAFWQPQIFTNENGQAKFEVTYPDNTTGWQTYVLGMDKHRRMGKAMSFVQSYKPVMAQLSMPQFLMEGDSAQLVGKSLNYTDDTYITTTTFSLNGTPAAGDVITLQPKASVVKQYNIVAPASDTLKTAFSLQTTTGFKDGEERKIPVFKPGTEEAVGNFWVLKNDTAITFTPTIAGAPVELYAQNNTLDILLDEINHLKIYPYYCMEQTSSKLRGLLMEKKICEALHKPFKDDKTINWLVQKLQKAQLYSGGWAWWENGKEDINITNYVIKALLPLRANAMVETNIRNGLLYLQNQLTALKKDQLLAALLTMCEAHHEIDYKPWLDKIYFDSLTIHQQWQYVNIKQLLKEEHAAELTYLLHKAVPGMLGGLHWGEDNYRWYSDANATTTLAFEVLQQEKGHDSQLNGMIQYFLEQRKQGYWLNTVTSASIVSATLPYLLAQNNSFTQPASIAISGDTGFVISQFPYKTILRNTAAKQFGISKSGGGLVYLTAYQHFFNPQPQPVTNSFNIHTTFEKNGRQVISITAGEKVNMIIHVNAIKDAEYVMMEIPIPAGCTYAAKNQDDWRIHKEFLKNKVILFAESLSMGDHTFTIALEPRYNGSYTLNPAKASLMYFPTFYGRNEMKKVVIKE